VKDEAHGVLKKLYREKSVKISKLRLLILGGLPEANGRKVAKRSSKTEKENQETFPRNFNIIKAQSRTNGIYTQRDIQGATLDLL